MMTSVPSNKDIPLTPYHEVTIRGPRKPETPMEALMQAVPGEEIMESVEELQPFREAVANCIDQLSEQDRYIIDAVNTERISLEELGERLGVTKTHAWRLRNSAQESLKKIMIQDPTILERLRKNDKTTDYGGV